VEQSEVAPFDLCLEHSNRPVNLHFHRRDSLELFHLDPSGSKPYPLRSPNPSHLKIESKEAFNGWRWKRMAGPERGTYNLLDTVEVGKLYSTGVEQVMLAAALVAESKVQLVAGLPSLAAVLQV